MKRNSTNFKRATRVILMALLIGAVGLTKGFAYEFSASVGSNTLYFNIIDADQKTVRVTYPGTTSSWDAIWGEFTKPTGSLAIPATVVHPDNNETYTVTAIGNYAFYGCSSITSLVLPSDVSQIGSYAFYNCTGITGTLIIPNRVSTIGASAFLNCTRLTGLVLPNNPTYYVNINDNAFRNCYRLEGPLALPVNTNTIGKNAFVGCYQISCIIIERYTAITNTDTTSFINTKDYPNYNQIPTDIPIYTPAGSSAYQGGQNNAWKYFTNFTPQKRLNGNVWSNAANWTGGKPAETDVVCLYSSGQGVLDEAASVRYAYFGTSNKKLALENLLTCTEGIHSFSADQLTIRIKDDVQGQLKQPINGLQVTVEKDITGYTPDYTETNLGYYFVCNPLIAVISPENVENMLNGNYDLYRFNPAASDGLEWINYESHPLNFNMSTGYGFLYANEADQTLKFVGNVYSSLNKTLYLNYVYNENENDFNGWRLVGNPFVCNGHFKLMTADNTEALPTDFYKMKEDGSGLDMCDGDYATLKPCEGAFFYCNQSGKIYFYSEEPIETAPAPKLNISLSQNRANIDQARVRFGNYNQLPKFNLFENNSKLYIPQDGTDYAVVSSQGQEELPINFKAEKNGTYTLSFDMENVAFDNLRLIDNLTGVETDLLAAPSYTFTARTTDYASRFRLVFSANNVNENAENDTFAYFNGSEWVVNANDNATLEVIDMMGRTVLCKDVARNVSTNGWAQGVYVIRLTDNNSVKTQKIVVR